MGIQSTRYKITKQYIIYVFLPNIQATREQMRHTPPLSNPRHPPREDRPEPEGLIPRARNNGIPRGTNPKIQDPICMPSEHSDPAHPLEPPEDDLVQAVPVGADELPAGLAEDQVADLGAGVHAARGLQGGRVVQSDAPVRCAPPARQQGVLQGAEAQGFHCCCVGAELAQGGWLLSAP